MSPTKLKHTRETYLEDLTHAATDEANFKEILEDSFALFKIADKDLAIAMGVSRPTVTRWRNGNCAPHPMMRKPVYDCIARLCAKKFE